MKLLSKTRQGEIYQTSDIHFKINKAKKRIEKELTKSNFKYEIGASSKSNTVYLIVNDITVVRIATHTERKVRADKYKVLNYREVVEGMIVLEQVNILSNEDMFEFIDYLRKHKLN